MSESVDKPVGLGNFGNLNETARTAFPPLMANKRICESPATISTASTRGSPVLTRWLEEFQPDIVGLQELKCTDEAFPRDAIEALGYSAIWHGQRSWNGVALLSKVGEPVETRRALPDDPNSSRAVISRRRSAGS